MTPIDERVRAEIGRRGPLPFEEVMELALYHPDGGFYASGGQAGRRGDFLTSPEVGPLFGAVVARALDGWWVEAGRPDPFVVVEAGAGPGTLARTVLAAAPRCAAALRYVLVERSERQRAGHARLLPLEDPAHAFAAPPEPDDDQRAPAPAPAGPIVVSLSELPRLPGPCTVLANELLDNLPVGLLERTDRGWSEVRVGVDGDDLVELLVEGADGPDLAVPPGTRVPTYAAASAWLREARALAGPGGRVVAFDYGLPLAELAARPMAGWLRTYRDHAAGGPPLVALGHQDLTVEIAPDALRPPPDRVVTQADWLRAHGIDDLVEDGRREWRARAGVGDLAAVRARSRVTEGDALLDPVGLGSFLVLEWTGGP